jgi:dTDP-glucose pyrophosphorylase
MIQIVVESLPECSEYIFIAQKEHEDQYHMTDILNSITGGKAKVILIDGITEGAAITALKAKEFINDDEELLIANSDQYIRYNIDNFNVVRHYTNADGIIFVFQNCHSKWSYVRLNEADAITEVAEKRPISDIATCGVYWFVSGNLFVNAAEQMIAKNIRTNNEFYLAPCYNEIIAKSSNLVLPFWVNEMHGLGTPEDLQEFIKSNANIVR